MRSDELIRVLVDAEVLVPDDSGEGFSLSETFTEQRESSKAQLEAAAEVERGELVEDALAKKVPPALERVFDSPSVLADYVTVTTFAPVLEHRDRVRVLNVLGQLRRGLPPDEGAPEAFLPVHGDLLPCLVKFQRAAIVYVWREDCEPCDLVRGDFDELFEETPPQDIMLYAVYGPGWAVELDESLGVQGAPTTLFVLDGEVDARLLGAHTTGTYENEIAILRERLEERAVE